MRASPSALELLGGAVHELAADLPRQRRIRRTREELAEGMRRPCCWPGCKHRERTGKP